MQNESSSKVNGLFDGGGGGKNNLDQSGSVANELVCELKADSENNVKKLDEIVRSLNNVPCVYGQDIVRHKMHNVVGVVSEVADVSSKDLVRVSEFTVGDYVVFGPWLGRVDDVVDDVTVLFDDGSVCKVKGAEPLHLKPISKGIFEEDEHFPYHPGQRVRATSSSVFKNSRWLSGLWKANRLEDEDLLKLGIHDSAKKCELDSSQLGNECDSGFANEEVDDINESMAIDPIRKVLIRREKKTQKQEEDFERALLIVNTRTRVDIAWQDGTIEHELNSTTLIPIDSPGDHEFVAEQYVVEKASDDVDNSFECRRVGVVKSLNAKERTTCVRWLKPVARAEDPHEFDKDEIISVYELKTHPDYDYSYGDVVIRLSPVSVSDQTSSDLETNGESKQQSRQSEIMNT
ncbi:ubiquitin-conjugating enzyme [Salix suchowensis]|nr:ubiquitin-conjugating enzyme [Salix suchowensis]